ncbi:MAG: hypothetical protein HY426_02650 [Candidatus Levybacteria bacterium]|nr:hypothetical protein [Candidatus Levybacteria bacterium]
MKDKQERGKPRFDHKQVLPTVIPEGMELYKFYGKPVLIPARAEGEELVGNTTYTARQIERLNELSAQRDAGIILAEETSIIVQGIDPFEISRVDPELALVRELLRQVAHGELT